MDSFFKEASPERRSHSAEELGHFIQVAEETARGDEALRGYDDLRAIEQGRPLPSEQPKEDSVVPRPEPEAQALGSAQETGTEVAIDVERAGCPVVPLPEGVAVISPVEINLPNSQD
jgi:hypothetical protein